MDKKEDIVVSPDEQKAEEEMMEEVNEDDVRDKLAEELGLDADEQSDLLDSLTKREMENRKALSTAIGQKIKYRQLATKDPSTKDPEPTAKPMVKDPEDIDALVNEKFEQRDLEALDYPDDIKTEIKRIAKATGVSVREAVKDPYIQFKIEQEEKEQQEEEATTTRKPKGKSVKFDVNNPPKVDMSTQEGREVWTEYTKWLESQG